MIKKIKNNLYTHVETTNEGYKKYYVSPPLANNGGVILQCAAIEVNDVIITKNDFD